MERNFHVGDRVVRTQTLAHKYESVVPEGAVGTVLEVTGDIIGVYWDNNLIEGHSLEGKCPNGHGWRVRASKIELLDDSSQEPLQETEEIDDYLRSLLTAT